MPSTHKHRESFAVHQVHRLNQDLSTRREIGDTITYAQHVPSEKTVQALREQLNQDTQILAALDPDSATYQRLADRVERQTAELLDYEDQRAQQQQAMRRAMIEQHRRAREAGTRMGGVVAILIGGFITYIGWGTWWLMLGILLVLGGLGGLLDEG